MFSNISSSQHLATATGLQAYSGTPSEDIEQWIRTFKLFVLAKNFNELEAKLYLSCFLSGDAKIFYKICSGEEKSVDEMLNCLRQRYLESSIERTLSEIDNLQKDLETS